MKRASLSETTFIEFLLNSESIFFLIFTKVRKNPINKIHPLYTHNIISQVNESLDVQIPIMIGKSPTYT